MITQEKEHTDTPDLVAAQEMVTRGKEQIATLEQTSADYAKRTQEIEAERADIEQTRAQHREEQNTAHGYLERCEADESSVVSYAKLAQGTIQEHKAVQAVSHAKKTTAVARKAYDQLVASHKDADVADLQRDDELSAELASLDQEQARIDVDLTSAYAGYQQVHTQYGQLLYTDVLYRIDEQQIRVNACKEQLLTAQVEQNDLHTDALTTLAPWPDLHKEIERLVTREDSTSRVLEATLFYVKTLLSDVSTLSELSPDMKRRGLNIWNLIIIPADAIYPAAHHPQDLIQYRERLTNVLTEYYRSLNK